MKLGIVDVGGGLRGVYGAGILDYCMDEKIDFDFCAGVSAGSSNVISYMANQRGRNYTFYTEYAFRSRYMSLNNFFQTRSYIGFDYYGELSKKDGENPLDFDKVLESNKELLVVATNAQTGKAKYFSINDMKENDYSIIMASSCLPIINRPYVIEGEEYMDGGMSDPIPFMKAFEVECDKVVVVLTRPKDFRRSGRKDYRMSKLLEGYHPNAAEALRNRSKIYNKQLDDAIAYEKKGKVLIVAPDDISGLKTLTKDKDVLINLYHKAYKDAEIIKDFIKK